MANHITSLRGPNNREKPILNRLTIVSRTPPVPNYFLVLSCFLLWLSSKQKERFLAEEKTVELISPARQHSLDPSDCRSFSFLGFSTDVFGGWKTNSVMALTSTESWIRADIWTAGSTAFILVCWSGLKDPVFIPCRQRTLETRNNSRKLARLILFERKLRIVY